MPVRSATATENGCLPVGNVICGAKFTWLLVPPRFKSTLTVSLAELATMMSGLPSPFKSATASEYGFAPTGKTSWGRKVPSPLPMSTLTVSSL